MKAILFLTTLCGLFHLYQAYMGQCSLKNSLRKTSLKSLGSDVLVRPDDEDSPEFKEYLRKLLRMQVNRANSGFSAPSSGSADAYIAKLNRLKLELRRRRELGLPDEPLDTSYKPEDYQAALAESKEPLVSDTVLKGGESGPGRKLRALTPDEIRIAQEAEDRVQAALARQAGLQAANGGTTAQTNEPATRQPDELDKALDQFFLNPGAAAKSKPEPLPRRKNPEPVAVENKMAKPNPLPMVPPKPAVPVQKPEPKLQAPPAPTPVAAAKKEEVKAPVMKSQPPPVIPVAAKREEVKAPAAKVQTAAAPKKKLNRDELEILAKALQKLVKHR
jgi:hypothetical protein